MLLGRLYHYSLAWVINIIMSAELCYFNPSCGFMYLMKANKSGWWLQRCDWYDVSTTTLFVHDNYLLRIVICQSPAIAHISVYVKKYNSDRHVTLNFEMTSNAEKVSIWLRHHVSAYIHYHQPMHCLQKCHQNGPRVCWLILSIPLS